MSERPFFSIVIPTLNEEKYLPLLLSDLESQSFPRHLFEIVHIDGNSDDATIKKAQEFTKKLPIKSFTVKKRNVAYQRNFGTSKSNGKWILFMDADNRLPNYFLDGIKYQISLHPTTDLFTTWVKLDDESNLNGAIERTINVGIELYRLIGKESAFGALIGVKRKIAQKIHFSEKHKIFEDAYFVQECVKNDHSFRIFREPFYYFCLRRVNREGKLKMLRQSAILCIKYLQGNDFIDNDYGYAMLGGGYQHDDTDSYLKKLKDFLKQDPIQNMKKIQEKFSSFRSFHL